ncbi:hypothetical protein BJY00DRAFT_319110 [Aspergillus carlsbadensis]|nr:hypothetical protein BJY00DRAFT_319110 [Aspergillus carlsbadensis]
MFAKDHFDVDTSLYTIAWIATGIAEFDAACLMLDKDHGQYAPRQRFCIGSWYVLGEACGQKVALIMAMAQDDFVRQLACLSLDLDVHFPNLRSSIVVSVGSGIPSEMHDVRLGDVVVSTPQRQYGGVVNVDGDFSRHPNDLLEPVAPATLGVARLLERDIRTGLGPRGMLRHLAHMKASNANTKPNPETEYAYPGVEKDRLYPADYECQRPGRYAVCTAGPDDTSKAITRPARTNTEPKIHFGTVAACRGAVEYAMERELIREYTGALAAQAGAEYLMTIRPLVVVGVADYGDSHADSHEGGKWKKYAAVNAAACAKDLTGRLPAAQ